LDTKFRNLVIPDLLHLLFFFSNFPCTILNFPVLVTISFSEWLGEQCCYSHTPKIFRLYSWRLFIHNEYQSSVSLPSLSTCTSTSESIRKRKYCVHFLCCWHRSFTYAISIFSDKRYASYVGWLKFEQFLPYTDCWFSIAKIKKKFRSNQPIDKEFSMWMGKGQYSHKYCCTRRYQNHGWTRSICTISPLMCTWFMLEHLKHQ